MALPRIGLTVGDPSGIGPEICTRAANDPRVKEVCIPIMYGPVSESDRIPYGIGMVTAEGGHAAFNAVRSAVEDALSGRLDAIATAPINKSGLALAGFPWRGHTDLLAHLTGVQAVAMMFYTEKLRVVLSTVHIPLSEVPRQLTQKRVEETIRLAHTELPRFGFPLPRLALAGLNPHAGEQGLIGNEEERILKPAVEASRNFGININGPLPGDTVFVRAVNGEFDAVVACYHDQGLIPVKLLAFRKSVNVTLGLPIVRTSVDHGTAYDIAGKGIADPSSMIQAVLLAARLTSTHVSHD
jgi:4-hydroxythreonine-4-phosphate dehydrogenase